MIVDEPDLFIIDPKSGHGQRARDPDPSGAFRAPILIFSSNQEARKLEFGHEIEYFREHGAVRGEDAVIDGAKCARFKLTIREVAADLYVDLKTRAPRRLDVGSEGQWMKVHYQRFDRKQAFDPKLFSPPSDVPLGRDTAGRRPFDTPFDGFEERAYEFVAARVPDGKILTSDDCSDRPVLMAFLDLDSSEGQRLLNSLRAIYGRYKNSQLCFLVLPLHTAMSAADGAGGSPDPDGPPIYALKSRWRITAPDELEAFWSAGAQVELNDRYGRRGAINLFEETPEDADAKINAVLFDGSPESSVAVGDADAQRKRVDDELNIGGDKSKIRSLLANEDFEGLDRFFGNLRAKKVHGVNGAWELVSAYHVFLEGLSDEASYEARAGILERWIASHPESVTARTALGKVWIASAWRARGNRMSNKTTPEQFSAFGVRLEKARSALDAARNLREKDPETYVSLIGVSMGQGRPRDDVEDLLREGLTVEPGYQYLHAAMARYLMPKWHGASGDFEDYIKSIVKEDSGGIGAEMAARVAIILTSENEFGRHGQKLFRDTEVFWPDIRTGWRQIIKRWPASKMNLNLFAQMACAAGDKKTASEVFDLIGNDYSVDVWGNAVYYEHVRHWARSKDRG